MIYLDYNATAPMKPAVRAAVAEAMERYGNASSVHRFGRIVRRHIEDARANVAALVGVKSAQVIFTSGGTESNNLAVRNVQQGARIATSSIEHESILSNAAGAPRIPANEQGIIDLEQAKAIMRGLPSRSLVSVMLVNNETGIIQPVARIAEIARAQGHYTHTDAVQAAGRLPVDFDSLGADYLSLSAHKIGGPQGVGALIVSERVLASFTPLLRGGGQEMNRRPGTENVPGIAGFGAAAQLAADDLRDMPRLAQLRDRFEKRLQEIGGEDVEIIGKSAPRVANTACLVTEGMVGETQVMAMDLEGVAVSAGAACSSGKVKPSHVLLAMGLPEARAKSGLRVSLGWKTEASDIERCVAAWQKIYVRAGGRNKSKAA
ncbi:MAG: cysteine desulfurase family protein [Bdellovibrionales bacterium]